MLKKVSNLMSTVKQKSTKNNSFYSAAGLIEANQCSTTDSYPLPSSRISSKWDLLASVVLSCLLFPLLSRQIALKKPFLATNKTLNQYMMCVRKSQ